MQRFLLRENVNRLRLMLANSTDDSTRARIACLLTEAQDNLAAGTELWHRNWNAHFPAALDYLLEDELEAFVEMQGAGYGSLQLYDARRRMLMLVAQMHFPMAFVRHFAQVAIEDRGTVCADAALLGKSVMIPDLRERLGWYPQTESYRAGPQVRAVQSTPIFSANGDLWAVFSSHYAKVHPFDEGDRRNCDAAVSRLRPLIAKVQQQY